MGYTYFRPSPNDNLITLRELAIHLGVSDRTTRRWCQVGKFGEKMKVCQTTRGMETTLHQYHAFISSLQPHEEMV